ncbi:hypothetical protein B0H14DRAFT_3443593 [Mycena olivaceomarginata]|nr:hypothetical protein B0H14DRAFT_3443593 [Mycena olivaceomarginata]
MTGTYSGRMWVNALATGISWRETTNDLSDYAHRHSIARSTVLLPFTPLPSLPLPRRLVFLPRFYYSTSLPTYFVLVPSAPSFTRGSATALDLRGRGRRLVDSVQSSANTYAHGTTRAAATAPPTGTTSLTFFMRSAVRERRVLARQPLPLLPPPSHAPIPFHRVYRAHSENEKATSVDSEEGEEERQGEEERDAADRDRACLAQ